MRAGASFIPSPKKTTNFSFCKTSIIFNLSSGNTRAKTLVSLTTFSNSSLFKFLISSPKTTFSFSVINPSFKATERATFNESPVKILTSIFSFFVNSIAEIALFFKGSTKLIIPKIFLLIDNAKVRNPFSSSFLNSSNQLKSLQILLTSSTAPLIISIIFPFCLTITFLILFTGSKLISSTSYNFSF